MTIDPSTERFEIPIEVLPEDIDAQNHVSNIVYVRWIQDVSTAHWDARATDEQKKTIGWVVVRHEIDYLNSARLGDEVIGRTWVGAARRNIFERCCEFLRATDQKLIARARSLWCPIDLQTLRPMRVGPAVRERFSSPRGTPGRVP